MNLTPRSEYSAEQKALLKRGVYSSKCVHALPDCLSGVLRRAIFQLYTNGSLSTYIRFDVIKEDGSGVSYIDYKKDWSCKEDALAYFESALKCFRDGDFVELSDIEECVRPKARDIKFRSIEFYIWNDGDAYGCSCDAMPLGDSMRLFLGNITRCMSELADIADHVYSLCNYFKKGGQL
jgi:hypothetical protein